MIDALSRAARRGITWLLGVPAASPGEAHGLPQRASLSLSRSYFRKWLVLGALIGVVAGLGAIVFFSAIALASHLLLGVIAGYVPPGPAGEGATVVQRIARPWAIPLVTTLGGLLCGLLVYTFAPEAEGHGTDAAIDAFHNKGGFIRPRVPLVKTIASAITIGSGGSAGREGPTAQIAAGFGSMLGDFLHLDEHDRRIAMSAGIGAGIGSIFKAPFGGALLSAEVLYQHDLEAEALFPSIIASVVGYSIYGAWAGWTPVFGDGHGYAFQRPITLVGFALLGIVAGAVGLLYPVALYGLRDAFARLRIPNQLKPALGGLAVGVIGIVFPQALGMGYGWVQFAIDNNFVQLSAALMLALVFVKMLTTSLTIGSGGSGGVFGPGMVIGGFLGAAVWAGLHRVAPGLVDLPGSFVVVGMGAFFGGVAKAPLAVMLMVAEMTNEFSLIVPAMLATMIALLITGNRSIYEQQVSTRLDSPAHKDDYALPLLQQISVRDVMQPIVAFITPATTIDDIQQLLEHHDLISLPVIDGGHLSGIVTADDVGRATRRSTDSVTAKEIMTHRVVIVSEDESLYTAWMRMTRRGFKHLPVVSAVHSDRAHVVGEVTLTTIGQVLHMPSFSPNHDEQDQTPSALRVSEDVTGLPTGASALDGQHAGEESGPEPVSS
jgi:CIC family chloride channel protein